MSSNNDINNYTLYGAEFSLYSGKARSYLRKKGIPFNEVTSTLNVYKRFIIPRTGVRYIPVVQTPDDQVIQDTTVIIDELESRFNDHSVYPETPRQKQVALLLELYGDEWLLIPAMHYRWFYKNENARFIYGEFGRMIMPKAPAFIQRYLGKKIGNKFKDVVPRLGVSQNNYKAIEKSYEAFLSDLDAHFNQHDFLLGSKPCIADFGFIAPLYAHLYRDPKPGKLMRERAPNVVKWVERMIDEKPYLQKGEWLADDEIPKTLEPILKRMASEQIPVLLDTDKQLSKWREENPHHQEIERYIGTHDFEVEGVTGQRVILPYCLWMYRRPVDYYQSLDTTQKAAVDGLLSPLGFSDVLQQGLANKLVRTQNKLQFESSS